MRFSLSAATSFLFASSGPLAFVNANADPRPKPDTIPDSTPTKTANWLKARQTQLEILQAINDIAKNFDLWPCVPYALPLVTSLPKIPKEIIQQAAATQALSQTTRELSEVCDFSITGDVGETFTTFLPTWYSWYNRHSDRLQSIITRCPKASLLVSTIEAYQTCSQVVEQIAAASVSASTTGTTTTPTTSATSAEDVTGDLTLPTVSEPTETVPTDEPSAARETGFLGAAVAAAAGVLGVVAMI